MVLTGIFVVFCGDMTCERCYLEESASEVVKYIHTCIKRWEQVECARSNGFGECRSRHMKNN